MDYLTYTAKIVEFGAWPVVTFAVVCILQKELRVMLLALTKLKLGPVELAMVVKEVQETKVIAVAAASKANAVAAQFDESEDSPASSSLHQESLSSQTSPTQAITDIEKKILKAMVSSRFVTRSVNGVSKDSGLDKAEVQVTFGSLIGKGLVEQTKNDEGKLRWVVTALGRQIIS